MAAKLTLRMDERLIAAAKRHAEARGTSASRMIAAHVEALQALAGGDLGLRDLPAPSPRVRALGGVLPSMSDLEAAYLEYPVRKHACGS